LSTRERVTAAFIAALAVVLVWAVAGPLFGFSDAWMLVINTLTTIVTFLMGFLILAAGNRNQASQDRDTAAIQKKLDELLRAIDEADDDLRGIEKECDC
jgi:low affinity Fe/Cu permease